MSAVMEWTGNPDERPSDETLWERRHEAVSLRNAGLTYEQIGAHQGISAAQVRRDIELALRDYIEGHMDTMIAQHRSVLADIRRANYPSMLSGNKDAAKTILDGMAHEAKLLGMYAPARVITGVSEMEFSERFIELIEAVSPDTLKELLSGPLRRKAAEQQQQIDKQAPVDAEAVPESYGTLDPGDSGQNDGRPGPAEPEPATEQDRGGVDDAEEEDDDWSNL